MHVKLHFFSTKSVLFHGLLRRHSVHVYLELCMWILHTQVLCECPKIFLKFVIVFSLVHEHLEAQSKLKMFAHLYCRLRASSSVSPIDYV